jgi:hypothetical protein
VRPFILDGCALALALLGELPVTALTLIPDPPVRRS